MYSWIFFAKPGHKFFAKTQVPLMTAVNVILCAFTRFRIDGKKQRKHPKKLDQIGDSHKKQSVGFKVKLLTKENVKYFDPDLLMSFARGWTMCFKTNVQHLPDLCSQVNLSTKVRRKWQQKRNPTKVAARKATKREIQTTKKIGAHRTRSSQQS